VTEPLRLSFDIGCSPEHAFRTWTERFGAWWPPGHTMSDDPPAIRLEPGVGGRIFEEARDGSEIDWGRVTAWEPPHRLAYLWHIGRDHGDATDVELTFVDVGDGTTRLEIVHSGFERLGADADSYREANTGGWGGLIPHFVEACEAADHPFHQSSDQPQEQR